MDKLDPRLGMRLATSSLRRAARFAGAGAAAGVLALALTATAARPVAAHGATFPGGASTGTCYSQGGAYGHGNVVFSTWTREVGLSGATKLQIQFVKQNWVRDAYGTYYWRNVWLGAKHVSTFANNTTTHTLSRAYTFDFALSDTGKYTRIVGVARVFNASGAQIHVDSYVSTHCIPH